MVHTMVTPERHDLIVIGAGPAGLSAALTAESERIGTLVLDMSSRLGGQAGTSSFIENYPGFPIGISGDELMSRILDQALRFDTQFMAPVRVTDVEPVDEGILVHSDDRDQYVGTFALLSTGVDFRLLRARNLSAYLGRGATYGSPVRTADYSNNEVIVVGGANSAGQAAVHLAEFSACKVNMLVRAGSLEDKMSGYLVDKVKSHRNIHIHTNTELVGVDGNGHLERVTVQSGDHHRFLKADQVFVMIGSSPKTNWLPDGVAKDAQGFVMAGIDLPPEVRAEFVDKTNGREPFSHETSIPGLFVAGDVRCGTNKRVALAVGDGAAVVPELHRFRELQSTK